MKRAWVEFKLEVASILHIGSGTTRIEKDEEGKIGEIVKDCDGDPWIPGSTLKGALRKSAPELADVLFGQPHEEQKEDDESYDVAKAPGAGRVLVFGAKATGAKDKIFILRRTKVDSGTGVAEANKLFTKEYVDEGAVFDVKLCVKPRKGDKLSELLSQLETALGGFAGEDGLEIASGKADSLGRLQLVGPVSVRQETISLDGIIPAELDPLEPTPREKEHQTLSLHCRGPYLVHDPSRKSGREDPETGAAANNDLMALISGEGPRLLETGVSGALRKRAEWLAQLGIIKTEDLSAKTTSGKNKLGTLTRLLGDEGYRAKLKIKVDLKSFKQPDKFPSVKLNPLTHSPEKGALFFVHAFHDVVFEIRASSRAQFEPDEQAALDALLSDVKENGIQLGYGGSKGFGWFEETGASRYVPDLSGLAASKPVGLHPLTLKRMPDQRVTLPYRTVRVDPSKILMPEPDVLKAFKKKCLHNKPLPDSLSGHIDYSWLFETPLLVGSGKDSDTTGPMMMGNQHILPGTTIRGYLRNYLATLTNSRLRIKPEMAVIPKHKNIKDVELQRLMNEFRNNKHHNPDLDEDYTPDFLEALFGYVHEPSNTKMLPEMHRRLLLKSRVSFECAYLVNEHNEGSHKDEFTLILGSPTGESNIYDSIARKVYPADSADSGEVLKRIEAARVPNSKDSAATIRFLRPSTDVGGKEIPLHFRGRFHFHNVTKIELGAILWAVTLGTKPYARHRIGHAKAFGSGRARVSSIRSRFKNSRYDGSVLNEALNAFFGMMQEKGFTKGAWEEVEATDNPGYGDKIKSAGKGIGYQTWTSIHGIKGIDRFAAEVKALHGNRLAAALKPKQDTPAE